LGVDERWKKKGVLLDVILRAGEVQIGLSQDDWKKGRDRTKGVGMRIYVYTNQDIDQLATDAMKAGIALDKEPHDTPWGSRAFEVTEPSGFNLTISSQEGRDQRRRLHIINCGRRHEVRHRTTRERLQTW
jgi:uncharacterized glyoxalase superfamily protein PhnB